MAGHFKHKQILRAVDAWPGAAVVGAGLGRVVRRIAVAINESGELRQARQPCCRKLPGCGYRVRIDGWSSGEEIRHRESGRLSEEDDRDERGLEAQLIDCADIFAHIVDAVSATQRRIVMAKDVPREANSRSPSSCHTILES